MRRCGTEGLIFSLDRFQPRDKSYFESTSGQQHGVRLILPMKGNPERENEDRT